MILTNKTILFFSLFEIYQNLYQDATLQPQTLVLLPFARCYFSNKKKKGNVARSFSSGQSFKDNTNQITSKKSHTSKFITAVINKLNLGGSSLNNDEYSQRKIENFTLEEFESVFSGNKNKFMVGGINSEHVNPLVGKYFLEKENEIFIYINNLLKGQQENLNSKKILEGKDKKMLLIAKLFSTLPVDSIVNAIMVQFLVVYTYEDTDEDKNYTVVPVAVKLGKNLFNKYINILRDAYISQNDSFKEVNEKVKYSDWLKMWKSQNPDFVQYVEENDDFYATIGTKILEILLATNMFERILIKPSAYSFEKKSYYIFRIKDKNLRNNKNKKSILALPLKLPMLCPPKKHSETTLGGYLLNDEKFAETLIIHKKAYGVSSILDHKNKVYRLVNKLSYTPF